MNLIRSTSRLLIIDRGNYARSYQYHMKTFATSPAACKRLEKRAKTWDSKELCQLLSDSDGWDDLVASPVKPQVAAKTNGNRELELSEDDDDDDILILSEICPPKGHLQGPAKPSNIEKFNSSSTFEIRAPVNSRTQLDQFLERVSSQRKPTVELLRPSLCGSDERVVAQETLRVEQEDRTPTNKLGPPLLVGSEIKDSHFKEEEVLTQVSRSPSFDEPSASASLEDETNTRFAERKRPSLRSRNHELVFLTQKTDREASEEPASRTNSMINKKLVQGLVLSEEQESVIELAKEGYNIFYTGSAGTGKSVLLRVLIKTLRRKYGQGSVAITASTGLAACNIGGITVHSFAGFGLGVGDNKTLLKKVKRSKKHVVRWMSIKALVIDEVSMIEGDLLDKLDYVAKNLRKDQSPFGGIQIILSGDFFQLPPVNKNSNANTNFAFHADAWKEAIDATIMLQKVFRQQGDGEFIQMLNEMRMGNISPETEIEFKKLCRPLPDDDIIPAELYSTRNEVERANMSRLRNLPGECHTYHAIDGGDLRDQETKDKLLSNFLAPKELRLKVGAQVMMIKNIDETLVNGSLGKVIDFLDQDTYMFYERVRNNPDMEFEELESIRQGKTTMYESSEDDENNQKVIRKKTLKENFCRENSVKTEQKLGDSIFDFLMSDSKDLTADQKFNIERKKKMLQDLHASSSGRKLPLVRFLTPDGSSRCVLVQPEDWAVEDEQQKPIVSRVQLPLMLAWALSIHKSQGQTLPKVKVDLRRIFEKGQAYVALSRAVSRDGLQVLNFNKTKVQAHASVMEFYKTLTSANEAKKRFDNTSGKQQTLSFAPKPAKRMGSKGKDERQDRITSMLLSKNKRKLYAAQDDQNGMSSNFRLQQRSSEGSGQAL